MEAGSALRLVHVKPCQLCEQCSAILALSRAITDWPEAGRALGRLWALARPGSTCALNRGGGHPPACGARGRWLAGGKRPDAAREAIRDRSGTAGEGWRSEAASHGVRRGPAWRASSRGADGWRRPQWRRRAHSGRCGSGRDGGGGGGGNDARRCSRARGPPCASRGVLPRKPTQGPSQW